MITKEQQRKANSIARRHGYGRATTVIIGKEDRVVSRVDYGYRKYTTGQYVPNAYRAKFGWKNPIINARKRLWKFNVIS